MKSKIMPPLLLGGRYRNPAAGVPMKLSGVPGLLLIGIVLAMGHASASAAMVVLRITKSATDGILRQYEDKPGTYPITQKSLDAISFSGAPDDCVRADGSRVFDTTVAAFSTGKGEKVAAVSFTGNEVVSGIRAYEKLGFKVDHVVVFREDWLKRKGPGGPWDEDIRILAPKELANIRKAIAASNLKSKGSVKIIQLLGPRVAGHRGDSWFECIKNPKLMKHLRNFDGIGTECHVGDHATKTEPDGPETLKAMAAMTKWAAANKKVAYVFMGGSAVTYVRPVDARNTYAYLWKEMDKLRIDKKSDHLIYMRQGARPGKQTPESSNTLSSQIAELMGEVRTGPVRKTSTIRTRD